MVRCGGRPRVWPGGAQVAAEAMTYDRRRRTDCNTGRRDPGRFIERSPLAPRAVRGAGATPVGPGRGSRIEGRQPDRGTSGGVEYTVRAARITDIDRFVALSGDRIGGRDSGTALDAADMLRQLVYLPHASILVAERRREIVGGAVLAIRPSVRFGGYVGTVDLLVVAPGADADAVTEVLLAEALRSAANKGCASIEASRPDDPAERARWEDRGFKELGPRMGRALAPAGVSDRGTR
jgi:hypothetical protein